MLIQLLSRDCEIVAITGRNEKFRWLTDSWFRRVGAPVDALYMRKDNDFRKVEELKLEYVAEHFGSLLMAQQRIIFCLDDTDAVITAYRNAGLPTYQVRPGGN